MFKREVNKDNSNLNFKDTLCYRCRHWHRQSSYCLAFEDRICKDNIPDVCNLRNKDLPEKIRTQSYHEIKKVKQESIKKFKKEKRK